MNYSLRTRLNIGQSFTHKTFKIWDNQNNSFIRDEDDYFGDAVFPTAEQAEKYMERKTVWDVKQDDKNTIWRKKTFQEKKELFHVFEVTEIMVRVR